MCFGTRVCRRLRRATWRRSARCACSRRSVPSLSLSIFLSLSLPHTHTHTHTRTHTHARTHTHTRTNTHIYTHTHKGVQASALGDVETECGTRVLKTVRLAPTRQSLVTFANLLRLTRARVVCLAEGLTHVFKSVEAVVHEEQRVRPQVSRDLCHPCQSWGPRAGSQDGESCAPHANESLVTTESLVMPLSAS